MNVIRDTNPIGGGECWRYDVTYVTRTGVRIRCRGWFDGAREEAQAAAERAYARMALFHGRKVRVYLPKGDL